MPSRKRKGKKPPPKSAKQQQQAQTKGPHAPPSLNPVDTPVHNETANSHDAREPAKNRYDPIIGLTTVIAFAALIQAGITWFQWEAMNEQNEIARGQLDAMVTQTKQTDETLKYIRESRRAKLFVREVTATEPEVGKPIVAAVTIENSGEMPATITDYKGSQRLRQDGFRAIRMNLSTGKEEIGIVVPPKATIKLFVSSEGVLMKEDFGLLDGLALAERDRTVEGIIEYVDTSDSEGSLKWRWVYKPQIKAFMQDDRGNDISHDPGE